MKLKERSEGQGGEKEPHMQREQDVQRSCGRKRHATLKRAENSTKQGMANARVGVSESHCHRWETQALGGEVAAPVHPATAAQVGSHFCLASLYSLRHSGNVSRRGCLGPTLP